jgi:hypothetical protein
VKSKTFCGAWGGKEMATRREFENLREKMQSTLEMMFYEGYMINTAYLFLIDYIDSVYGSWL